MYNEYNIYELLGENKSCFPKVIWSDRNYNGQQKKIIESVEPPKKNGSTELLSFIFLPLKFVAYFK